MPQFELPQSCLFVGKKQEAANLRAALVTPTRCRHMSRGRILAMPSAQVISVK